LLSKRGIVSVTKKDILDKLSEVIDPELNVNIVELGLIYSVEVFKEDDKQKANVEMTFTTPACPMINYLLANVESKLNELKDIDIEVRVVFSPPWTPEKMSKEAKVKLGMM
jgi:metal-sulfur cluster biosynthetic enzyme